MDEKLNAYIESLIAEIAASPSYVNLSIDDRIVAAEKIRDHFNSAVFDLVIDHLTPQQLESLKDLSMDDPKMGEKLEEYSSTLPLLATSIEELLVKETEKIKQNPSSFR